MARPQWMREREVQDAQRPVTINIRQKHINDAVALNGAECVAGRCTLQALDAAYVWFYRSKAYVAWDDNGPILRYQNSQPLIKKVIEILDDPKRPNSEIKPGLYDLRAPTGAQKLGTDRSRKGPKRTKHTAHARHRVVGRITSLKESA
jgi:hypothetical protein